MEQAYSNIEKAGIVFAMMGADLSEAVLSKLSKEVLAKVQKEVLPLIDQVQLPMDIDAFVLTEIIQNKKIVSEVAVEEKLKDESIEAPEMQEEKHPEIEEIPVEDNPIIDWQSLSDELLFETAPNYFIIPLLIKENNVFRTVILDYFPDEKKRELKKELLEKSIILEENIKKTSFVIKMESDIKKKFAANLREECSKAVE